MEGGLGFRGDGFHATVFQKVEKSEDILSSTRQSEALR